eukprot:CAMPEP_0115459280 /NCGR_PEP_ID=MMETSP0271-20121206/46173_1 /TAXON_ID=71861 /ORGANISM="Scrippsiella trochoidea, Strain CCMP3099" /LENGTH=90 /DNA_ID=CAMNT_0002885923 /DNA_START=435 /DNA_END=707 /DNA_ORIENTATION=+
MHRGNIDLPHLSETQGQLASRIINSQDLGQRHGAWAAAVAILEDTQSQGTREQRLCEEAPQSPVGPVELLAGSLPDEKSHRPEAARAYRQ